MLGAIAGYDPDDPVSANVAVDDYIGALTGDVKGLKLGVLGGDFRGPPLLPEVAARLDDARGVLRGLGMTTGEALLDGNQRAVELTADLLLSEAAAFHAERLAENPGGFAQDVQTRLRRGQAVTGTGYAAGRQEQRIWRRRAVELLEEYDVLLSPACPIPAPLIAESDPLPMTGVLAHFTSVWVLAGVPAMVVPIGFVDGMPVAMQLIGRHFDEATAAARGARLPAGHRLAPAPAAGARLGTTLALSDTTTVASLPLEDVRVVAVEQYGAGPWGTLQLADLGAEIIKIEDPSSNGDVGRYVPPFQEERGLALLRDLQPQQEERVGGPAAAGGPARARGSGARVRRRLLEPARRPALQAAADLRRPAGDQPAHRLRVALWLRDDRPARHRGGLRLRGPGDGRLDEPHRRP